jgi:predicted dehydrogenase
VASVGALQARQRFAEMEGDDTSIAQVRFVDGTVGTLVESFIMKSLITASGPEVHTLRIDGDLGSLTVCDGRTIHLFSERPEFLPGGALAQHDIYVPEANTFDLEIAHFLSCVYTGKEPGTSGRSQRRPLEIVLAAYESMASGMPVTLPLPA